MKSTAASVIPRFSGNSKQRRAALRRWLAANGEVAIKAILKMIVAFWRKVDTGWHNLRMAAVNKKYSARAKAAAMSNRGTDTYLYPHEKMLAGK